MVLCQLHQDLSSILTQPNTVDWSEYSHTLSPATIRESAKWIRTTRAASNDFNSMTMPRAPIDISTLNTEQSIAYTIVQRHCHSLCKPAVINSVKNDCVWYSWHWQVVLNNCHCSMPRR